MLNSCSSAMKFGVLILFCIISTHPAKPLREGRPISKLGLYNSLSAGLRPPLWTERTSGL